jgi:hypothetical protein
MGCHVPVLEVSFPGFGCGSRYLVVRLDTSLL